MSVWVVRKRNYCTLSQEKGRRNERLPGGNSWLTMHIMAALVRIHSVILGIAFTFKHGCRKQNLSIIHTSHDLFEKPTLAAKNCTKRNWMLTNCWTLHAGDTRSILLTWSTAASITWWPEVTVPYREGCSGVDLGCSSPITSLPSHENLLSSPNWAISFHWNPLWYHWWCKAFWELL